MLPKSTRHVPTTPAQAHLGPRAAPGAPGGKIAPGGLLIAGQRRLDACKMLGWDEVPVHVVDIKAIGYGDRRGTTAGKAV